MGKTKLIIKISHEGEMMNTEKFEYIARNLKKINKIN